MKNNKDGKLLCAKYHTVVLGNSKERLYQQSQFYAPFLKYRSISLLTAKAVRDKRILQQGNYKNSSCNATLLDNEVAVIRPPIGDPGFQDNGYWIIKKTIYGLRLSPHNWYNVIKRILIKKNPAQDIPNALILWYVSKIIYLS